MSRDTKDASKDRRKKAPEGFYSRAEAQEVLGLASSTFGYYVEIGRIKRTITPPRKEGYYNKKEIDRLATEIALALHTTEASETRVARIDDAPAIVRILTMRGWKTASAEQRISWYAINPYVDYIVATNGEVMGYIHAVPYTPDTLEGLLSGKKRSWHVQPTDILPYEAGQSYDLYIGIATRTDIENHTHRFGFRLIAGFMSFIVDLAQQGVRVRRFYAASDQPDGMKLCQDLKFDLLPRKEGDLFNRYCLDMETSQSLFARRYRVSLRNEK